MPKVEDDYVEFKQGEKVGEYEIVEQIAKGGTGAIYKCFDSQKRLKAAKVEWSAIEGGSSIKMEINVLTEGQGAIQFPSFFAAGRTKLFNYLILELLETDLKSLKERFVFEWGKGTWSRLGIMILNCVHKLHTLGYLHRDIKPGNFGVTTNSEFGKCIKLLDFGLCRRFVFERKDWVVQTKTTSSELRNTKKVHRGDQIQQTNRFEFRLPRRNANFRGTVNFASPNADKLLELGRHDDIYSAFYTIVDLAKSLPWRDKEDLINIKKSTPFRVLLPSSNKLSLKLDELDKNLENCTYFTAPMYQLLFEYLEGVRLESGTQWAEPYDFEAKWRPAAPKIGPWASSATYHQADKWANLRIPAPEEQRASREFIEKRSWENAKK